MKILEINLGEDWKREQSFPIFHVNLILMIKFTKNIPKKFYANPFKRHHFKSKFIMTELVK